MQLNPNEKLIRKSRGNFKPNPLDPFKTYGGQWCLTDKRLFFKGRFQDIEESIPLSNIESIEARHNDFLSCKIYLYLKNNSVAQMNVSKKYEWVNDILSVIKGINNNLQSWNEAEMFNVKRFKRPQGWYFGVMIRILVFIAIVFIISLITQRLLNS